MYGKKYILGIIVFVIMVFILESNVFAAYVISRNPFYGGCAFLGEVIGVFNIFYLLITIVKGKREKSQIVAFICSLIALTLSLASNNLEGMQELSIGPLNEWEKSLMLMFTIPSLIAQIIITIFILIEKRKENINVKDR